MTKHYTEAMDDLLGYDKTYTQCPSQIERPVGFDQAHQEANFTVFQDEETELAMPEQNQTTNFAIFSDETVAATKKSAIMNKTGTAMNKTSNAMTNFSIFNDEEIDEFAENTRNVNLEQSTTENLTLKVAACSTKVMFQDENVQKIEKGKIRKSLFSEPESAESAALKPKPKRKALGLINKKSEPKKTETAESFDASLTGIQQLSIHEDTLKNVDDQDDFDPFTGMDLNNMEQLPPMTPKMIQQSVNEATFLKTVKPKARNRKTIFGRADSSEEDDSSQKKSGGVEILKNPWDKDLIEQLNQVYGQKYFPREANFLNKSIDLRLFLESLK